MAADRSRPSSSVIFDSNVWIAYLYERDTLHEKAKSAFKDPGGFIVVPEYILIETATVLKQKKRYGEASQFVQRVLQSEGGFLPSGALAYETGPLFCQMSGMLSFTDTALLLLSRQYRVITFDKALARAIATEQRKLR